MATSELSSEEKKAYRKAFDHFDKNNDGTININELGDVMKNLGKNPSKEELKGKKKLFRKKICRKSIFFTNFSCSNIFSNSNFSIK